MLSGRVSKMKWKIHATEFQQFGITGLIFAAAAVLGILYAPSKLSAGYETVSERCSALAHDIGRGFIGAQIDEPRMAQGPALKQR